jgi:hypothetical protein
MGACGSGGSPSTSARGAGGSAGYRLTIATPPDEPLRTLVYATPIARFFMC